MKAAAHAPQRTEAAAPERHSAPPAPGRDARSAAPLQSLGNMALQTLLEAGALRRYAGAGGVAVGAAGDEAEREADRLADAMLAGKTGCTCAPGEPPCAACAGGHGGGQGALLRKPRGNGGTSQHLAADPAANLPSLGPARGLTAHERAFFEPRLGADLAAVRVHDGAEAAASAAALDARAFALGPRIAFGAGEYRPQTEDGRRLLGHELAHIVLGHGGIRRQPAGPMSEPAFTPAPSALTPTPAASLTLAGAEANACYVDPATEDSIVFMGRTIATTRDSVRAGLTEAVRHGGMRAARNLRAMLENLLPHRFCSPITGNCRDVVPRGAAVTERGRATIGRLLPMIDAEITALEAEHAAFKALVRSATGLRLRGNVRSLDLWSAFISSEISASTLQGQVAGTVVQRYAMMAFHHPDQTLANRALEQMLTTRSVADQRTQAAIMAGEIHGGCAHCHRLSYETNVLAGRNEPYTTSMSIMEQLQAGSEGPRPAFAEARSAPGASAAPSTAPTPTMSPGVAASPTLSSAVSLASRMNPYLQQLGPRGYKILPLDDVNALGLPPEALRTYVLEHIAERRAHFLLAIDAAGRDDFDYLMPLVVVQELIQLQDPALQALVNAEIRERAEAAQRRAIGLLILGAVSLLLTIFPPTAALGLALGAVGSAIGAADSYQTYQQGVLLGHMVGATDVITPQQEAAASQMRIMGQIGMIMSALDLAATGVTAAFSVIRVVRAAGTIRAVEVQAGNGTRVLIEGLDSGTPVATATGGGLPPTRIVLPGQGGGGGGGGGRIIIPGSEPPLTGPVTLHVPGRGVPFSATELPASTTASVIRNDLVLLDDLGRAVSLRERGGRVTASMDATLLGESRLIDSAGRPLGGGVPPPWRQVLDASGRPQPFSPRTGPTVLDLQAGTPAFGSGTALSRPGTQVLGAEGGNWMLGYHGLAPTHADDMAMALMIARNSPQWPNTPAFRTAIEGMPHARPWEMDPARHLFPQQGPFQMLADPLNPHLGQQFFPALGGQVPVVPRVGLPGGGVQTATSLVPRGLDDLSGVATAPALRLPGRVDEIVLRRTFGLGTLDEAGSRLMGTRIRDMLAPGGFVEIRATRATDIGAAQIDAIAAAIPGSTRVRVTQAQIRRFAETGSFPPNASSAQQDMIRAGAADTAGLGAGDFKYVERIYAPR